RLKKPATLFQQRPLRRTYTNLSVLSTSSASGSPSKKLQTQRTKELQDATLEGLSETDTEESDAEPVQPKPVQPERRRSVQISDVKEVREPAGLPISIPRARTRRVSVVSNMSKLSASSFFMQENQSTGYLGHFLRDPESSYAAYLFANLWNYFIAVTVLLSLSQTTKTPLINGMAVGIAEAVIEFIFLVECVAEVVVEVQMQRFDFMKHMYTVIDVLAVAPLPVRAATGFVQPSLAEEPWAHYTLVCLVPLLRLLKLIRRFGQIQLLAHVFRTTGDALKFLLFLVSIIVLLFSTLLYILEPDHIVDSMFTAMWVSTVTVTTVGYGDITPITLSGKMLMGSLCFFSSLFMAMPISVLGNAMSHAWTDRNRILLMARTRQRLKRHGFQAADLPRLFRQYDGNQTGDLSMDEFCDMIVKMKVGMGPREAEELFELFDVDGSGGIDDKEFMKALFPDDYRRIFLRSESIRRITTTDSSRTSPASPN
ncbi:Potassium voltage-gated channel subfamily D member 3 (Voltage-gated potassium channel subunit Kv4.3), partial [Durusdinium trenchii]